MAEPMNTDRPGPPNGETPDATVILRRSGHAQGSRVYAALVVVEGPEIGNQFRLRRSRYTIGRAKDADICLRSDAAISRTHAVVESRFLPGTGETHYIIEDLKSTNQTLVNGKDITQHMLAEGDVIQVGDTILKFKLLDDLDARFHKEVQRRIQYDSLTSLLTKESLYIALDAELRHSLAGNLPLSVLMMDIDFFKRVNDTYGHLAGSAVLTEIGAIIHENLREVDLCGRYGGEEFLAYLPEVKEEQALAVAERLRQAVADHEFIYDDQVIRITISIGISLCPEDGETIKGLVGRADEAMYWCKENGRNRVCVFGESSHD